MCILIFPTTVTCNFISGINQRGIVKAHRFLCNVPVFFFPRNLNKHVFLIIFEEKSPISNFLKNLSSGS